MKPISLEIEVPKELTLDIEKNLGDLVNVSDVHGDLKCRVCCWLDFLLKRLEG